MLLEFADMPARGCVGIWDDIQHVSRIWSKIVVTVSSSNNVVTAAYVMTDILIPPLLIVRWLTRRQFWPLPGD